MKLDRAQEVEVLIQLRRMNVPVLFPDVKRFNVAASVDEMIYNIYKDS